MASIEYSPEQKAFFSAANKTGIFFNQANAGSGKTECSSELFVRIYAEEEERLFPKVREKRMQGITLHVSGKEQFQILKQFIVITFTVKAAEELNTRILAKFRSAGIPVPVTPWGKPVRICRTIDSLLQTWFRNRSFFAAWNDWEFEERKKDKASERSIPRLSLSHYFLQKGLKDSDNHFSFQNSYDFFHSWPTLLVGDFLDAIIESIIRKQFKEFLKSPEDPLTWKDLLFSNLTEVSQGERSLNVPLFDNIIAATKERRKFQEDVKRRIERVEAGMGNPDDRRLAEAYLSKVELWQRIDLAKDEFLMVYGIAKTRMYHPFLSPDNLNNTEILEALAQNQVVNSVMMFHSLATKFARAKNLFGVMDYSDFMDIFLHVCKGRPEILDLKREYPRYGIRAKNLIIDETQDNAPSQYEIMRLMIPVKGVPFRSIAVGDAKQSIYAFRGASPKHFINAIERYKISHPDRVFSLSCSFRSCKRIVALGNEIVSTLPSYRHTVVESSTIYDEDGEIDISPPLKNLDHEARFVLGELELIETRDPGASVMILARQSLYSHPLWHIFSKMDKPNVQMLTIHRSKGLEADYVFVLGLTSGEFPDVRGSWDQEINLFYVAATRARRKVTFAVPIYKMGTMKNGSQDYQEAGPSPFIKLVPSLERLAKSKGWEDDMLMEGYLFHEQERDLFQANMATHMARLRGSVEESFPEPTYKELEDVQLEPPTSAPDSDTLSFMRRRKKAPPKGVLLENGEIGVGARKSAAGHWNAEADAKLKVKLLNSFKKNMQVPKTLKGDELARAITLRWISHNGSGGKVFTDGFRDLIMQRS